MKDLLKGYEILNPVFMLASFFLMLLAGFGDNAQVAIGFFFVGFFFMMLISWTSSSTYVSWKTRKGY
jgi:hypothetical protein